MSASKIAKADSLYKESFIDALIEYQDEGRYHFLNISEVKTNFDDFVADMNSRRQHFHRPFKSWVEPVPETIVWLVKDHDYIGTVCIRHRLNWHLEKQGGNVNFIIRPSMRGKGFGKKALQKAMPVIGHLGIDNALLTAEADNLAAKRIIEFCGGVYEDTTPQTERFPARERYWLDCS